ncbi:MAG: S41 family peptidase [bacterium]|nr:S41 family peptidase [bacterium]
MVKRIKKGHFMIFFRKKTFILAFILILSLCIDIQITNSEDKKLTTYQGLRLFSQALNLIKHNYVEPNKIDDEKLIYGAIEGLIKTLDDPYTHFLSPSVYKEMKVETSGKFGGLGIVISIKDDKLTVISPIEDTPAHKIGIQAGDIITKIEGDSTKGITLHESVRKLRGCKGTEVTITIQREDEDKPIDFTITRDIIKIDSVKSAIIRNKVAYIRIATFNQNTPTELDKEIRKIKKYKNLSGIILDLRNNPGGLLNSAVDVSNCFIKEGVIVSTKGRYSRDNQVYLSKNHRLSLKDSPLVVLINEGSASGSEIVAGAIQDSKRGTLIGKKSFGKGSVQTIFPLAHETGIALTTAKYYAPSGRSIHDEGIAPDKEVEYSKYSKEDLKAIFELRQKDVIKKFVKEHKDYTQEDIKDLLKKIEEKKISLKKEIVLKEIKKEKYYLSLKKKPIYDLDIDNQLKVALDMLVKN